MRSVTRAFMNTMGGDKRQGGSTITQQVAKNLLVGDNVTFERKIREVIVATRVEKALSKQEILEIYLNSIYLGRSSWGIDLAARSYFGKPVKDVDLNEAAFLAGLTKGPAYFNPDKYRDRAQERLAYVLTRMKDDGSITEPQMTEAEAAKLNFVPNNRVRRNTGFHLVDEVGREARAGRRHQQPDRQSYQVRSTIRPGLQRAAEAALQDGLAQYEQSAGRVEFQRRRDQYRRRDPQARRRAQGQSASRPGQAELAARARAGADAALRRALDAGGGGREAGTIRASNSIRVGLPRRPRAADLDLGQRAPASRINLNDVVYVKVVENSGQKGGPRVELRTRPQVQGVGAGDGEQDRPDAGDGRRLLLSAEPAQPRDAIAPPAGLLAQAADLSRGADPRPAAQHADSGRADHLSADRRRAPLHPADRLVVAAQLRRRLLPAR